VAPQNATAGTLPVIVYLHGGDQGTDVSELLLIVSAAGLRIDDYVFVQPSFRSEPLRALGSSWLSGGQPGPWDRDVDDALALLDVALSTTPGADPDRIVLLGQSRGGGVALLMAARDSRIAGVVEFFGPTDFFDSWVREIVEDILRGDNPDLPGLNALASRWILPFAAGDVTLAEMRRQLLLRSPAYFAARLPRTQVHHGSADDVVSVTQTQSLIAAMNALGRGPPDFEAFIYAGGGHNPLTLPASIGRAALFLESVTQEAAAVR
jgi:dipeptidyl aminopeptidase/acylaminoacyl peptidase